MSEDVLGASRVSEPAFANGQVVDNVEGYQEFDEMERALDEIRYGQTQPRYQVTFCNDC